MDDRLLVINKNPAVMDEIIKAYENEEFLVDVAYSGVEGYKKLQENEYKVVMTGMVMPDINGEKLIHYINKEKPDTICIVYTTSTNAGQIIYLTNKMDVFRMFLRPGDYKGEMLEAINEAFELYNLRKVIREQEEETANEIKESLDDFKLIRSKTIEQKDAEKIILNIVDSIVKSTVNEYTDLSDDEKAELLVIERAMIARYLEENRIPAGNLMALEVKLRHHFCEGMPGRSLGVHLESNVIQLSEDFIQNAYMAIYYLTYNVSRMIKEYDAHISVGFETSSKMVVSMDFQYQGTGGNESEKSPFEKAVIELLEKSVTAMCEHVSRKKTDGIISYQLYFDTGKQRIFN